MNNNHIKVVRILCATILTGTLAVEAFGQSNYIKVTTYLNKAGTDSYSSVQYYDEWGRKDQECVGGLSANGYYLVGKTVYDNMGRPSQSWTPFPNGTTRPDYISDFASASRSAFSDAMGYSQTTYDGQGRVIQQTQPGKAFEGHPTTYVYAVNTEADTVKHYSASLGSTEMSENGYYAKGELLCETTIDPDGQKMTVFTDKLGRKVLERRAWNNDTYYVYDEKSQLRFVLSPKYQEEPDLEKFAYIYRYDGLGRVVCKQLPGCDSVVYEYDHADRVVKMQDGLLRADSVYRVYSYDGLGRLTKQSISKDGKKIEYDEIVNFYDNYEFLNDSKYAGMTKSNVLSELTYQAKDYAHGQVTGVWQRASNGEELLTAMAYDSYGRLVRKMDVGLGKNVTMTSTSYNFVGDVTGDNVTYYAYDVTTDYLSPTFHASTTNKYNTPNTKLLGASLYSILDITTGRYPVNGDTLQSFTYDDFGHVIANSRKGTGGDMTYGYDKLHGWLTRVKAGCGFEQTLYHESGALKNRFNGSISAMTWRMTDSGKMHRYDYAYDGLNRLTDAVYSVKKNNSGLSLFPKPSFDDVVNGKAPISLIPTVMDGYDSNNHYTESVTYDANSNIKTLQRYGMLNDKSFGLIDDLSVEYNGNQRVSVEDESDAKLTYSGAFDFVDGVSGSKEYTYNGNGALTKDLNKGVTSITYDLLGNPLKVTMKDGNNIEYVYAADGTRLKVTHNTKLSAGRYSNRDRYYRGNLIFVRSNDKLPYTVLVPGGYYFYESADEAFYLSLYVQDYQGNNRAELYEGNNVFEQTHYYPFGGVIGDLSSTSSYNAGNDFKYSGKELDRQFGLDLYDFHARQYDPLILGFNGQDKHAEKYYWLSPYSYCAGNPVNCVDLDGKDIFEVNNFGYVIRKERCLGTYLNVKNGEGTIVNSIELSASDNDYDAALGGLTDKKATYNLMSSEQALTLQNIMTQNTDVEWTALVDDKGQGLLMTSHDESKVTATTHHNACTKFEVNENDQKIQIHGHPGRNAADGSTSEGVRGGSDGDMVVSKKFPKRRNFVNHQATGHIYEYDANNTCINEWNSFDEWKKAMGL